MGSCECVPNDNISKNACEFDFDQDAVLFILCENVYKCLWVLKKKIRQFFARFVLDFVIILNNFTPFLICHLIFFKFSSTFILCKWFFFFFKCNLSMCYDARKSQKFIVTKSVLFHRGNLIDNKNIAVKHFLYILHRLTSFVLSNTNYQ